MKPCIKCSRTLALSEFYAHPYMADGHLNICKECHKEAVRTRYKAANGRPEYERARSRTPERKQAKLRYQRERRARHPDRFKANEAVDHAIRAGRLVRQPCSVCGDPKSEAHHPDYAKPLEVEWLCFKHHREHGHGQTVRMIG